MAKFTITISHDEPGTTGLAPIRDIISNGLSCIAADVASDATGNILILSFDADPESIECTIEQYFRDEDDDVAAYAAEEIDRG